MASVPAAAAAGAASRDGRWAVALVWGASRLVEGESLNTEQVLAPVAVVAVLAAMRWIDAMSPRRACALGLLGGLAILQGDGRLRGAGGRHVP